MPRLLLGLGGLWNSRELLREVKIVLLRYFKEAIIIHLRVNL
ncbi:MAG: hypothetical protein QW154_03045 [Sulfolobales archaeon]